MKHCVPLILLAFLVALAATGCSNPGPIEQAEADNWAVVRLEADPDVLNPVITTSPTSNYIMVGALGSMISDRLLRNHPQTGKATESGLATGYPEVSADHLVYTFTIRDGVKWHDGHPFSVEDVFFTVKAAMVPSVDAAAFRSNFASVADVEIVGRNQIRFTMTKPYWLDDEALAGNIVPVPKHVYDPDGVLDRYSFADILNDKTGSDPVLKKFGESFNRNAANRAPIGTGPYKLDKWTTGRELVLVRNEDYWGQKPRLGKVVYKVIPDPTTALAALKSGEIDFLPRMSPAQFQDQTSGPAFDERFVKAIYQIPQLTYIGWNQERPYFADKRVRQALTMLVDRPKLIQAIRHGMGSMAASPFVPGSPDFNPSLRGWSYNPKLAATLLEQAGWIDSNHDGIRDKDGIEFKFEISVSSSNAAGAPILAILQDAFGKAGISVTSRRLDPAVFTSALREHKADAAIGNWTLPLQFDPYQLFHSSARNRGLNYYNFNNPEADTLLEQARVEFDPQRRKQLYRRFQEIFHEEQPYTPLYYPKDAAAYHIRFLNVHFLHQRPGYELTQWSVVSPDVRGLVAAN